MKKYFLLFFLFLLISTNLYGNPLSGFIGDTQDLLTTQIATFSTPIKKAAQFLLYALAIIELVLVFGFMAIKGELEMGGIFAQLIKIMLIIMLFHTFFLHPEYMKSLFNGFNDLADKANGGTTPSLDAVMDNIGKFWGDVIKKIKDNGLSGIGNSLLLLSFSLITTLFISLMVGKALQYYIFLLFSLYVGIFWFGFASFSYTRSWAYNAVVNIIRQGAKWMIMMLVMGIMFSFINHSITYGLGNPLSLLKLVISSMILYGFSIGIDGWVDSYFTGHGGGENNHTGQMLKATTIGATVGAIGGGTSALSQVKASTAVGQSPTPPGIGNSGSGESTGKGTGKIGNFMKSAAKNTTSVVGGAAVGAVSGAVKGSMGFSTHSAGKKSGTGVGKAIIGAGNAIKGNHSNTTTSSTNDSEKISGSISNGNNDNLSSGDNSYISGVPGSSNEQ